LDKGTERTSPMNRTSVLSESIPSMQYQLWVNQCHQCNAIFEWVKSAKWTYRMSKSQTRIVHHERTNQLSRWNINAEWINPSDGKQFLNQPNCLMWQNNEASPVALMKYNYGTSHCYWCNNKSEQALFNDATGRWCES
jgi:hypothetical protein